MGGKTTSVGKDGGPGSGMVGSTPAAGVVPPPHTRYSSILLGVEGCAPGKRSPFGTVHQASGRSNPVSVRGSRKWRAFAANFKHLERGVNADLVIPMDLGGMRATVTKVGPRLFCRAEDPFWECDVMFRSTFSQVQFEQFVRMCNQLVDQL